MKKFQYFVKNLASIFNAINHVIFLPIKDIIFMRKFSDLLVFIIALLTVPEIINNANSTIYQNNKSTIWVAVIVIGIFLSIIQIFDFKYSANIDRILRQIKFYLFKTVTIATVLIVQLAIVLFLLIINHYTDLKLILLSFGLNLFGINLLIITGRIQNTDVKELVLNNPSKDGSLYLLSNNKLRFIPDPPTFNLLGLSWGEIIDVSQKEFDSYEKLPPITKLADMKLYQYKYRIYGLMNEKLKYIPNQNTLNFIYSLISDKTITQIDNFNEYKIDVKPFASLC